MQAIKLALKLVRNGLSVFPTRPGGGVVGKKPIITGGFHSASRDEVDVKAWWAECNSARGVAVSTHAPLPDGYNLVVIDVDIKNGARGWDTLVELGWEPYISRTWSQTTESGGKHIFFKTRDSFSSNAGTIGGGIDIRGKGGYVKVYEDFLSESRCTRLLDLPDEIARKLPRKTNVGKDVAAVGDPDVADALPSALVTPVTQLLTQQAAMSTGGRNDRAYYLACVVKDFGCNGDRAEELIHRYWNSRNDPPLTRNELRTTINNAFLYGRTEQGGVVSKLEKEFDSLDELARVLDTQEKIPTTKQVGQKLKNVLESREHFYKYVANTVGPIEAVNMEFAHIENLGVVLREHQKDAGGVGPVLLPKDWFTSMMANKFMTFEDSNGDSKKVNIGKAWMASPKRRSYANLTFDPSIEGHFGGLYNMYSGFSVVPNKDNKHPGLLMWLDHIENNLAANNTVIGDEDIDIKKWFLQWCAHLVQNPGNKSTIAIVIQGKEGTGKGRLFQPLNLILGSYATIIASQKTFLDKFNHHLEKNLLLIYDEARCDGGTELDSKLKDLVTSDRHYIERKFVAAYTAPNHTRLVILGNNKWLVPAGPESRRYAVFEMGAGRRGDSKYWTDMQNYWDDGGIEAILHYLLEYDLSDFDKRTPPTTGALEQQRRYSLNSVKAWWMDVLVQGARAPGLLSTSGSSSGYWVNTRRRLMPKATLLDSYTAARAHHGRLVKDSQFHTTMEDLIGTAYYDHITSADGRLCIPMPSLSTLINNFKVDTGISMSNERKRKLV